MPTATVDMRSQKWYTSSVKMSTHTGAVESVRPDFVATNLVTHVSSYKSFRSRDSWLAEGIQALNVRLEICQKEVVWASIPKSLVDSIIGNNLFQLIVCQVPKATSQSWSELIDLSYSAERTLVIDSSSNSRHFGDLALLDEAGHSIGECISINSWQEASV